jgi:hypothetical protein
MPKASFETNAVYLATINTERKRREKKKKKKGQKNRS